MRCRAETLPETKSVVVRKNVRQFKASNYGIGKTEREQKCTLLAVAAGHLDDGRLGEESFIGDAKI
jgi:hypothetical protein